MDGWMDTHEDERTKAYNGNQEEKNERSSYEKRKKRKWKLENECYDVKKIKRELWRAVHDSDRTHECRSTDRKTSCCAVKTTPVFC